MGSFAAFCGHRYDTTRVELDDVVAPPYDVVDVAGREALSALSPHNSILLELPEPDEAAGLDRYEHAARLLAEWTADEVLRRDTEPALYVYRTRYDDAAGRSRETTGLIGALGIDAEGRGEVLPHEETMPKPKGDRLYLLRATRANLSPIWGLSPAAGLAKACAAAVAGRAPETAHADGVTHECWPVTDPATIDQLSSLVTSAPVIVADGHHRYETAGAYLAETGNGPAAPEAAVLALVVELAEEELSVQAIHRVVSGLPQGFEAGAALTDWFEVEEAPADGARLWAEVDERRGIGLVTGSGDRLLVPRPTLDEAAGADLDSARIAVALAGFPPHEVTYQHGREAPVEAVRTGAADLAFLLRPATVDQIAETARSRRRMPPKTTFFEPKPRTGMVFRLLD